MERPGSKSTRLERSDVITRMLVNEGLRAARSGGGDRRPPVEVPGSQAYIKKQMQDGLARMLAPKPSPRAAVAVPEPETVAQRHAAPLAPAGLRRQIDGDRVLKQVYGYLGYMAVWPSQWAQVTAALYAAHAHAKGENGLPVWQYEPAPVPHQPQWRQREVMAGPADRRAVPGRQGPGRDDQGQPHRPDRPARHRHGGRAGRAGRPGKRTQWLTGHRQRRLRAGPHDLAQGRREGQGDPAVWPDDP